jgi:hypothetical protein
LADNSRIPCWQRHRHNCHNSNNAILLQSHFSSSFPNHFCKRSLAKITEPYLRNNSHLLCSLHLPNADNYSSKSHAANSPGVSHCRTPQVAADGTSSRALASVEQGWAYCGREKAQFAFSIPAGRSIVEPTAVLYGTHLTTNLRLDPGTSALVEPTLMVHGDLANCQR